MARFQKFFGGVEIAANGFVKNLVVENLSEDPSLELGRMWFNTTENTYKACVSDTDDDGNEVVVVRTFGTAEDLAAFIAELASQEEGHGSANVGFVGHDGANDKFSLPANNLEDTMKSVVDAIDADRQVIEDNEAAANERIDAVQEELDNTQAGAGLAEDGSYTANTDASYISEATTLADADNKLDAAAKANADAIAQEIQDRTDADTALQTYIDDNFLNKVTDEEQIVNAKVSIQNDLYVSGDITFNGGSVTEIVTEQLKIGDNIATLNSDLPEDTDPTEDAGIEINRGTEGVMPFIIWNESTDKAQVVIGKDDDGNWVMDDIATGGNTEDIQDELDNTQAGAGLAEDGSYTANADANYISEAVSLADADNKLDAAVKANADAIAQEVSDRTAGDDAIRTDLNGTRAIYEATDAATEFTITHNLNSEFVDVMVWVYDADEEKYYNDTTMINIEDANTIKVTLTDAAKIRATITNVSFEF